jgi:hypothetical protein
VNTVYNIRTDRCFEDCRKRNCFTAWLGGAGSKDVDLRTSGLHNENLVSMDIIDRRRKKFSSMHPSSI